MNRPCFILPNGKIIPVQNHWRDFVDMIYPRELSKEQKASFNAMLKRNGDPVAEKIDTEEDDISHNTSYEDLYEWCEKNNIVCINVATLRTDPKKILDSQIGIIFEFFKNTNKISVEYRVAGKMFYKIYTKDEFVELL